MKEEWLKKEIWFHALHYWLLLDVGTMTVIILLAFRICNMFQIIRGDESGFRAGDTVSERAPLLSRKDDDLLSWGSSYDSLSHDEEEVDEWLAVASLDGKPLKEDGEANSNLRRLCVMCFDAPRDCFFLPCGHCAACFACGTRFVIPSKLLVVFSCRILFVEFVTLKLTVSCFMMFRCIY